MHEPDSPRPARITWSHLLREPFRAFFPGAVAAGLIGVALWPLHFSGLKEFYPGQDHARLMAHGFFGGFIIGFLGTSLPRMLSTKPLSGLEFALALGSYSLMVAAHSVSRTFWGDAFFLFLIVAFGFSLARRFRARKDVPPPGFVLVAAAFISAVAGAVLALCEAHVELPLLWINLGRLLSYQGFVVLPILGVGGFILPRFFGLPNNQDFPESKSPPPGWSLKAGQAATAGLLVFISFFLEAAGWPRIGHGLRLLVVAGYLLHEIPVYRSKIKRNALAWALKVALFLLVAGLVSIALFPEQRAALLHTTLIGGFGVITFTVATRVVFGHSGNQARLAHPNRWLITAVVLMIVAMATRISGDFFPKIRVSHYNYGALLWAVGVLTWAWYVLPKVLVPDPDE